MINGHTETRFLGREISRMTDNANTHIEFDVAIHMKAKLQRISKGFRQLDVAHLATPGHRLDCPEQEPG